MGSLMHRGRDRRGRDVWERRSSLGFDSAAGKYPMYRERHHGTKTEARRRLSRLQVAHDLGDLEAFLASERLADPAVEPAPAEESEREERHRRIAQLRGEGLSLRAIADLVGVTKSQVARDLAGVPRPGVPDGTPATIRGRDGKTYPGKHHGS